MAKSTVYFTKEITPEAVLKMYRQLGVELPARWPLKSTAARMATRTSCVPSS